MSMTMRAPSEETAPAQRHAVGRSSHERTRDTANVDSSMRPPADRLMVTVSTERFPPLVSLSDSHAVPELAI